MTTPFATPVVLLIFNRPAETAAAVAAIRAVRPSRLLIVADGPRPGRPEDIQACLAARAAAATIDWPCTVEWNESATNLGCRVRVATGLDWVFARVADVHALTPEQIRADLAEALGRPVDPQPFTLLLSDMAPKTTGIHDADQARSIGRVEKALWLP
jgi:hypothetical protein